MLSNYPCIVINFFIQKTKPSNNTYLYFHTNVFLNPTLHICFTRPILVIIITNITVLEIWKILTIFKFQYNLHKNKPTLSAPNKTQKMKILVNICSDYTETETCLRRGKNLKGVVVFPRFSKKRKINYCNSPLNPTFSWRAR